MLPNVFLESASIKDKIKYRDPYRQMKKTAGFKRAESIIMSENGRALGRALQIALQKAL